jgi:hypothetical protein
MLGSHPLFSSVVPACDFCFQLWSKSPEVDESRGRRIEDQAPEVTDELQIPEGDS